MGRGRRGSRRGRSLRGFLVGGSRLVPAFFLALAANGVVIGIAGISRQVWKGAEVASAPIPGGGALDVEATKTVQTGLHDLNKRVDTHTETVNKRLYDLETRVFKGTAEGNDEKECLIDPVSRFRE